MNRTKRRRPLVAPVLLTAGLALAFGMLGETHAYEPALPLLIEVDETLEGSRTPASSVLQSHTEGRVGGEDLADCRSASSDCGNQGTGGMRAGAKETGTTPKL